MPFPFHPWRGEEVWFAPWICWNFPLLVSLLGVPSPLLSPSESSWRPLPGALGAEGCPDAPGAGMLPAPRPSQPGAGIHPQDPSPCSLPGQNPQTAWNGRTGLSTIPHSQSHLSRRMQAPRHLFYLFPAPKSTRETPIHLTSLPQQQVLP